jgi:hypothetical protein
VKDSIANALLYETCTRHNDPEQGYARGECCICVEDLLAEARRKERERCITIVNNSPTAAVATGRIRAIGARAPEEST